MLDWKDGCYPVSRRFDDGFFSAHDGRAECRAVFLAGNGLPARWVHTTSFTIAELGFGTGLNFFETVAQWRTHAPRDARLLYVAFELAPLSMDDILRALTPWPDLRATAQELPQSWPPAPGWRRFALGAVTLQMATGDANEMLPSWPGAADAWYLDGFAPAKNPELWTPALLRQVFAKTAPSGTFSTYTATGHVRRSLAAAGFDVQKVPGFAHKRHRLQGVRPSSP